MVQAAKCITVSTPCCCRRPRTRSRSATAPTMRGVSRAAWRKPRDRSSRISTRPQRWSDAQIAEEHQFTAELATAELAVAAPLVIGGETLFRYHDFRFAAFPWMRGRAPELDAPEARQILGRSLARIHQIGALRAFQARPSIGVQRLGWDARAQVLASALVPEALRERRSEEHTAELQSQRGRVC